MNVFFNDKKVSISNIDTENNVKNKLAIIFETLPKYIYFPDGYPSKFEDNKRYIVEDLLKELKDYVSDESNFSHGKNYFKKIFEDMLLKKSELNSMNDIIIPFIIYNTKLLKLRDSLIENNNREFVETLLKELFEVLSELRIEYDKNYIVECFLESSNKKREFEKKIKDWLNKNSNLLSSTTDLEKLEGIPFTDFIIEDNIVKLKLDIPEQFSILDIFNLIVLNSEVQFASCSGFYKIFGDFIPAEHWIRNKSLEKIVLYINKQRIIKKKEKEERIKDDEIIRDEEEEEEELFGDFEGEEVLIITKKTKEMILQEKEQKRRENEYDSSFIKVIIEKDFTVIFDYDVFSIKKQVLFDNFFGIFQNEIPILEEENVSIKGVFDFPNKNLNKTVLCDLILMDPIFENYITLVENKSIPKSKTTLYFYHESTGEITASIIEQKDDKYKDYDKDEDDEYYSQNSYIRVHILKCKSFESVNNFQFILSRLMELYYKKFNDIAKFYKLYIPTFQDTTKKTKKNEKADVKSKQLEKIEPTLFIKGRYIRNMCQEYPLNIDKDYDNYTEHIEKGKPLDPDNIYKKFLDEKKDILVFPKKEIKGYSPRRYICDTEKNRKLKKIYPGMKENKMKNKSIFKYLPCCFKTRQNTALKLRSLRKKDPSILNIFRFEGGEKDYEDDLEEEEEIIMDEEIDEEEEIEEDEEEEETKKYVENKTKSKIQSEILKHSQEKIKTNKFVKENSIGILPSKLNLLFQNIKDDDKENYNFYRYGVKRSPNSFIDVIQTINIISKEEDEYFLYTEEFRSNVLSNFSTLCKQENYESPIKEIKKALNDNKYFFNPLQFVTILERFFHYNIFIFVRDENNEEYLSLPFHKESYHKVKNNNKCVFIYMHTGSESDNAEYPQCEIIGLMNESNPNDYMFEFDYDSNTSQSIIDMYNKLDNVTYIENDDYDFIKKLNVRTQIVDTKGKTRGVSIENNGLLFSVLFDKPVPNFDCPISSKLEYVSDKGSIEQMIMNVLKLEEVKQYVIDKEIKSEIHGKRGNLKVIVLIENKETFSFVNTKKKVKSLSVYSDNNSNIVDFQNRKKISRYVLEYFYWLYSTFINKKHEENPILDIYNFNESLIDEFTRNHILIDEMFNYSNKKLKNYFSLSNSSFINNNRLILKSNEILKRLISFLRIELTRNFAVILNYNQKTSFDTFYNDVDDFKDFPNQIVLKDEDFALNWLNQKSEILNSNKYILYKSVQPNLDQPYFFKDETMTKGKVYLAQNTNNFEKAIQIGKCWKDEKYNPGYYVDIDDAEEFKYVDCKLFSYENSSNIVPYMLNVGSENDYGIQIVGYKIDDNDYFTTLLRVF